MRRPWAIGSSAANRLPTLHTCHPTHSAFQCSTGEDPAPPVVQREDPHAVGAPHHVRRLRDDRPGMYPRGALAAAVRGEQLVRPHHPQHPRPRDPDPVRSAAARGPSDGPRPGTASGRDRPERLQQRRVRHRGRRTPPRGLLALVPLLLACLPGVERRARALPRLTHALDPVGAPRGLGERGAHRRDRRIAKGRRCSAARARSQQLVLHRQLPDVPRRRVERLRHEVALAGLQAALKRPRPVPPVLQPVDLDAHFPRQRRQ